MRSLSSVIKAERVKLNGGVCRIPVYQAHLRDGKSEAPLFPTPDILPDSRILAEAEKRAAEIVAVAESRREEILAAADRASDEMVRQAEMKVLALEAEVRKSGYDSGYLEGMAEGQREGNRLRREGESHLQQATALREEMLERVEPQVVDLAICIAERLVSTQLNQEPETVVAIVRDALRQIREAGEILIRIHPQDLLICREKLSEMQAELRENSSLNLLADDTLKRGGCRIETSGAIIECLLDERFAKLREVLSDVASHE